MAKFYKSEVIMAMRKQGLVPVFYHSQKEMALNIIDACVKGGSQIVEFTDRGEGAADIFGEVLKTCREKYSQLILGVGSIKDEVTAGIYISKGADFVVGPIFNPRVAKLCNRHVIAYCPGCSSPSEINRAEEYGAEIIKVFPGDCAGGPNFFKAIHGPSKRTQLMPTGGVDITPESISKWIAIGQAVCLGIGSNLIQKELIERGDFKGIEDNVRKVLRIISEVRSRRKDDKN